MNDRSPEDFKIKDRQSKLFKERSRMPVHGAALKNPVLQQVLLSGRRKRPSKPGR